MCTYTNTYVRTHTHTHAYITNNKEECPQLSEKGINTHTTTDYYSAEKEQATGSIWIQSQSHYAE